MALFQFPSRGQRQGGRQNNGYQQGGSMFSFPGMGGQNQGYGMNNNQRMPPNMNMGPRQPSMMPGNFQNQQPLQGQPQGQPQPFQNQMPGGQQPQEPVINPYDPSIPLRPVYGPEDLYKMPPAGDTGKTIHENEDLAEEVLKAEPLKEQEIPQEAEGPSQSEAAKPYDIQKALREMIQNEYNAKVFYGYLSENARTGEHASIMKDISNDSVKACQMCQELLLKKYGQSCIPEERSLVRNISFLRGLQMGMMAEASAIRDFIQLKETLVQREREMVDSIIQLKFMALSMFQLMHYGSS